MSSLKVTLEYTSLPSGTVPLSAVLAEESLKKPVLPEVTVGMLVSSLSLIRTVTTLVTIGVTLSG